MTISPTRLFREARAEGRTIAMISLYDAPSAALCCEAGADILLVGDSMGNVILGYDSPLSVTMEDVLHHAAAVVRGVRGSSRPEVPVIADLPFGSYTRVENATQNAVELMRAGARGVKLEGAGARSLEAVGALVEMGVPVVGHLGFTPQSALRFGKNIVQGKTSASASRLLEEARRLEEAGCCALVLEVVTMEAARRITGELSISTVGIGAGPGCDGQVLVWHDLIGLDPDKPLRFVKRYAEANELLQKATQEFVGEVHSGDFPEEKHGWRMSEDELRDWESGGN